MTFPHLFQQFIRFFRKHSGSFKGLTGLILVGINVFFYKQNVQKLGSWVPFFVVLISVVLVLLSIRLIRHTSLPTKIMVGLLLGVVVGILFRDQAVFLRPIGTIFVRLISLIVVPLVFVSLFLGTASIGDLKKLGISLNQDTVKSGLKKVRKFCQETELTMIKSEIGFEKTVFPI